MYFKYPVLLFYSNLLDESECSNLQSNIDQPIDIDHRYFKIIKREQVYSRQNKTNILQYYTILLLNKILIAVKTDLIELCQERT